jgi:predicted Fe-Mo cluster-binding NifX family protein
MQETTDRTGAASAAAGLRIAVSSQNFRTVTSHAGKTRRFLVYLSQDDGSVREVERLDLPMGQSLHDNHGDDHPLYRVDVVVTGGCGEGFVRRMSGHGVRVVATAEPDPQTAARAVAAGLPLPPAAPHEH